MFPATLRKPLIKWPDWATRCAMILLIAIAFVLVDKSLQASTRMFPERFDNPVLVTQWITDTSRYGLFVAAALLLVSMRRAIWQSWPAEPSEQIVRYATLALAASIAWPFLTLKHNLFFDQSYLLDRGILILSLVLLWWRPVAIVGVLISSYLLMWQYSWPSLGGPVFAHKHLTLEVLACLLAWHILRAWRLPVKHADVFIVLGVLIAGRYWAAGYTKLSLGWFSHGGLENALVAANTHGWLASWSQSSILWMADVLTLLGPIGQWSVLAFECLALIFFVNRRFAIAVLVVAIVFHLAVIVVYGFVFWTWIIVDLVMIFLLRSRIAETAFETPVWPRLAVTTLLIATAVHWTDATRLGWFDTPVSYGMRYSVTAQDGQDYAVSTRFFAPYDDRLTVFSLSGYLPDRAVLSGPYGVSQDPERARALDALNDKSELIALERAEPSSFHGSFADTLRVFLVRSFTVHNTRLSDSNWIGVLAPPAQMQSTVPPGLPEYPGRLKILRAKAEAVTIWYHDDQIVDVEHIQVLDIPIPDDVAQLDWETVSP